MPANWVKVRKDIGDINEKYINQDVYLGICKTQEGRKLKVKKGFSDNFMDYCASRLYFDKFQSLIMKAEVKNYHNA